MIAFVLRLFGRCPHEETIRLRRSDGGLDVRCSACHRVMPLIARTAQERKRFKAQAVKPTKARSSKPADVIPMRRNERT